MIFANVRIGIVERAALFEHLNFSIIILNRVERDKSETNTLIGQLSEADRGSPLASQYVKLFVNSDNAVRGVWGWQEA